jgi:hypothetical protein
MVQRQKLKGSNGSGKGCDLLGCGAGMTNTETSSGKSGNNVKQHEYSNKEVCQNKGSWPQRRGLRHLLLRCGAGMANTEALSGQRSISVKQHE